MVEAAWMPDGHAPIADRHGLSIAQIGDWQYLWGVHAQHGQIGFRVTTNDGRLILRRPLLLDSRVLRDQ